MSNYYPHFQRSDPPGEDPPGEALTQATASGGTVHFAYDAGATKVKQDANGVATRY